MPKDRYRLYHVEKAKGGIGMTMTAGSAVVAEDSPPAFGNLHAYDDAIVPWIRRMTDEVHEHGAACMIQLTHLGRRTGWGQDDWLPIVAPSPLAGTRPPGHPRRRPRTGTSSGSSGKYADAAERMQAGGMDGIEIEAYGHLFDQFWSPLTNQRTDEYGGSSENRLRFGWAGAAGHPGAGRRRLPRRDPHGGRRAAAGRHRRADRPGDPAAARGRRPDRLRERHPRPHRRASPTSPTSSRSTACRSAPHLDFCGQVRSTTGAGRAARRQDRRRRHRPPRHRRGQGRPRGHDPGPPGRPAHRAQDR